MQLEIRSFSEEMIFTAGQLLAQRHRRDREKLPMLPTRFEEEQVAEGAIRATWQAKFKNGYTAFRDGKMIAWTKR